MRRNIQRRNIQVIRGRPKLCDHELQQPPKSTARHLPRSEMLSTHTRSLSRRCSSVITALSGFGQRPGHTSGSGGFVCRYERGRFS
jgi:hypothetical protein